MYFPTSAVVIEFLILTILEKEDSYGYEISQTVKLIANIKESTLYPILKRLESAHFVTTYTKEHQGRQRKYYAITDLGRAQTTFLKEEWQSYTSAIQAIIEGRLRHDKN